MSKFVDAIFWIDRRQAKLFHFSATDDVKPVLMHTSAQRQHHRADHVDGTKHAVDVPFLQSIVRSLDHSGGILIAGPGQLQVRITAPY